jgi:hypothetical protein
LWNSSRKQQRLSFFRNEGNYFLNVSSESHIQQAVSFIKNKNLHTFDTGRKTRCVLKMILKPSRGGNKNLFDQYKVLVHE